MAFSTSAHLKLSEQTAWVKVNLHFWRSEDPPDKPKMPNDQEKRSTAPPTKSLGAVVPSRGSRNSQHGSKASYSAYRTNARSSREMPTFVVAVYRLLPAGLNLVCCHVERMGSSKMGGSFMRGSRLGPEGGASGDHRVSWLRMVPLAMLQFPLV